MQLYYNTFCAPSQIVIAGEVLLVENALFPTVAYGFGAGIVDFADLRLPA